MAATVVDKIPLETRSGAPQNGGISAQTMVGHAMPEVVMSPGAEKGVGSWLCSPGPYRRYIEALSDSNPGLRRADPNNLDNPLQPGGARVVMLDAPATGVPKFVKKEFRDATLLRKHLYESDREHTRDHKRRRIYVMEGLAKDHVAALGDHFWMDPTFWLRQERTCVWSNDFTPVSDALPQPSLLDPTKSFHVQYCELREFDRALESIPCFCARTRRHVGMTAPRHFKRTDKDNDASPNKRKGKGNTQAKDEGNTTTAIVRRKVSWWSQTNAEGSWDVVILCDPQLKQLNKYPREKLRRSKAEGFDLHVIKEPESSLGNTAFQGGYVDFVPPLPLKPGEFPPGSRHPHESMLDDLVYYYETKSGLLTADEWLEAKNSAVFLKKIVAAHYLQLADYIKAMLPSLELKLTTAWVEEQEQWKQLGTISRRCGNYRDDIEDTLHSLGFTLGDPVRKKDQAGTNVYDWKDCEIDYQYVYFRLKILKERADNLMTSMTGLASIAGNRQNLQEAKRVKRLNLLALLFIPLAYTSSLFSMQDEYAPNKPQFWVYWVCAIGVVMFTSVVTWTLDRALNDAAEWTLDPFKSLDAWRKKDGRPVLQRTKTTPIWGKGS